MPPVRTAKAANDTNVILKHGARKVLMRCPRTYEAAIAAARKEFKVSLFKKVDLRVDMAFLEPGSAHGLVEISMGSWDIVLQSETTSLVDVLVLDAPKRVESSSPCQGEAADAPADAARSSPPRAIATTTTTSSSPPPAHEPGKEAPAADKPLTITITTLDPDFTPVKLSLKPTTRLGRVLTAFYNKTGLCEDEWRATYNGERVHSRATAEELDILDGDEILCTPVQCGGKPVIYLFAPTPLSARVELGLVPQWEFSAIYPVAPITAEKGGMTGIAWDVDVRADGAMLDKRTSAEVSYLYWEAKTVVPCRPLSPPPEGALSSSLQPFNPAQADVSPSNSVLLDVFDVPAYLDAALKAMTLHTEARTSFITYWLPAILHHKQIALRFLPQEEYEPAAPLRVTPAPDIVTRVFMLFRGIDQSLPPLQWSTRLPADWAGIVGVDANSTLDPSLFRVLEWGGMEVKSQ